MTQAISKSMREARYMYTQGTATPSVKKGRMVDRAEANGNPHSAVSPSLFGPESFKTWKGVFGGKGVNRLCEPYLHEPCKP